MRSAAPKAKKPARSDEGLGLLGVVPPGGGKRLDIAVVTSESVDAGLSVNEAELGVAVLAELLEMLSDRDGLLDKVVEVLGHCGAHASLLEDSEDLAAGDSLDLGDAVAVTEGDANMRRLGALLGELDDLLDEVVGADLHPAWGGLSVGQASASDTFSRRVHSSHFV